MYFDNSAATTADYGGHDADAADADVDDGDYVDDNAGDDGNTNTVTDWTEIETIDNVEPISAISFDHFEELLWAGSQTGRITSYWNTPEGFVKHSSFQAARNGIIKMLVENEEVISLAIDSLRFHTKGGLLQHSYSEREFQDLLTFNYLDQLHNTLAIGSARKKLHMFDINSGRILSSVDTAQGTCVIKPTGRFLCCGGTAGELALRDPRTLRVEKKFDVHTGTVTDIEAKGDLLVTCGISNRYGQLFVDPLVKVFDIRTLRLISQIHFPAGPTFLKFHPMFSSVLAVVSQSGFFQFRDVQADLNTAYGYQVDTQGDYIHAFDFADTAEVLAFGDGSGFIHSWSTHQEFSISTFYHETDTPVVPTLHNSLELLEGDASLASFELPPCEEPLFSDFPPTYTCMIGQFPPEIHPTILQNTIYQHLPLNGINTSIVVGYAKNPGIDRVEDGYLPRKTFMDAELAPPGSVLMPPQPPPPLQRRKIKMMKKQPSSTTMPTGGPIPPQINPINKAIALSSGEPKPTQSNLPKNYQFVQIKETRLGEFDFSIHNETKTFAGLENRLENSYVNAYIQMLYRIVPLRKAIRSHLCSKQFCLTCELGFLFHMMDLSLGSTCDQNNFLRSFRQINEAAALGLHEGIKTVHEMHSGNRIQTFNRFILDQINKEIVEGTQPTVLGPPIATIKAASEAAVAALQSKTGKKQVLSYADVASAVSSGTTTTTTTTTTTSAGGGKKIKSPMAGSSSAAAVNMLDALFGSNGRTGIKCNSCNTDNSREAHSFLLELVSPLLPDNAKVPSFVNLIQRSIVRDNKTRAWCSACNNYQVMDQRRIVSTLPNVFTFNFPLGDEEMKWLRSLYTTKENKDGTKKQNSPIPSYIIIKPDKETKWKVEPFKKGTTPMPADASEGVVYELWGIISHLNEVLKDAEGHLVAHIKDVNNNDSGDNGKGQWYIVNDFMIKHTTKEDALDFLPTWKQPCIFFFSRVDLEDHIPRIQEKNPITHRVFFDDHSLSRVKQQPTHRTFIPLSMAELPKKGDIVALDAEFVSLRPEEGEVNKDGTWQTTRDSLLSLARVSVIRGKSDLWTPQSQMRGVPFMDDFIMTPEPIADYLTRFSGLKPGDLDPSISSHHITTLKQSYLKLRWLVDRGVVFVGHGLKKDFKIINIVVPKEQIVDTVELFHFESRRKISLRFLAHHLLKLKIQTDTHDSIEDAKTALGLYDCYLQLKQDGEFEETLTEIYKLGRNTNWQLPEDDDGVDDNGNNNANTNTGTNALVGIRSPPSSASASPVHVHHHRPHHHPQQQQQHQQHHNQQQQQQQQGAYAMRQQQQQQQQQHAMMAFANMNLSSLNNTAGSRYHQL